jgi:NADP-dependent 3-hydroxy acid dehydrogenase YdfG
VSEVVVVTGASAGVGRAVAREFGWALTAGGLAASVPAAGLRGR